MITKLVRHLTSHKKVFNLEVDVANPSSIEQALTHLNQELLNDIAATEALCLQDTDRNKLLKLRFTQNNRLLSKQLVSGMLNVPWAEQVKQDLNALAVNLNSKDHGTSEFILARAALSHPELAPQLVDFVDRVTIFVSLPDSKLMSYSDLVNLGFMAAVAIAMYAPQYLQSAIALFNGLGKYKDGSYSDRFSSGVLINLYRQQKQYPQVSRILAHHLASFICYPDVLWSSKAAQIDINDPTDVNALIKHYQIALEQWCFDFHIVEAEHYVERYIQPLFGDSEETERIRDLYQPFKQAALNT